MKVERVSYDVMTPSAARGILEAIHWKPAILWVVDAVHVLKPIRFHTVRRNEVGHKAPVAKIKSAMKRGDLDGLTLVIDKDKNRQQRATTLLADVTYVIEAHFERTARADDGDTDGKHLDIFNRRAARGQCFHQPCLGTREFPARFELLSPEGPLPEPEDRSAELGFGSPRDLGFMLFDINHARDRASLFFRASLVDGVMKVPHPASPEIRR
ncbi:MAG: type I-C CRISPR-associated protein Cas5c [Rhizomicrobium sp.]|nr:type I-C CRISPR-associated protein Cas5c [Rhizomicrobium sp.]